MNTLSEYTSFLVKKMIEKYGMRILLLPIHMCCNENRCFFHRETIPVWYALQMQDEFFQIKLLDHSPLPSCIIIDDLLLGDDILPENIMEEIWNEVVYSSFYIQKKIKSKNLFFIDFLKALREKLIDLSPFSFKLYFDESKRYAGADDCDFNQEIMGYLEIQNQDQITFDDLEYATMCRDFIMDSYKKIDINFLLSIHGFSNKKEKLDWLVVDPSVKINELSSSFGKESVALKWIQMRYSKASSTK